MTQGGSHADGWPAQRNFQVFGPLDFLAEFTQHIPNQGEHLVRYYGHYSNKARGMRARRGDSNRTGSGPDRCRQGTPEQEQPALVPPARLEGRRWAMLIKRIYQADPLRCGKCGGIMNIIAFIGARQGEVIAKILEHCGLWHDPPSRAPPN